MHRALQITEILERTFGFVQRKSDLAAVLQTCRRFFDAGIEPLYEEVDTKACICMVTGCYSDSLPVLFSERIERFITYGKAVRKLDLDVDDSEFAVEDFLRIVLLSSGGPLFPNLRLLSVHSSDPLHLDFVITLLTPRLEEVSVSVLPQSADEEFNMYDYTIPVSCLLVALPHRCPQLRVLEMRIPTTNCSHPPSPSYYLGNLLSKLETLTTLTCDMFALEPPSLVQLARHPKLRELFVGFTSTSYPQTYSFPPVPGEQSNLFATLRQFACNHMRTGSSTMSLLKILPTTLLELELSINTVEDLSEIVAGDISRVISRRFPSLEHCHLVLGEDESTPLMELFSMDPFMALRGCTHMRSFSMSFIWEPAATYLTLQNHHICDLAAAWPDLQDLELSWSREEGDNGLQTDCYVGLEALKALATHCPKFQELKLSFLEVKAIPMTPLVRPAARHVVFVLDDGSPVVETEAVAVFLSMIWPHLSLIGVAPTQEDWGAIKDAHRLMSRRLEMAEQQRRALEEAATKSSEL